MAEEKRFADDVMLFATSKEQLQNMMYDFKKATEKVGLKIHPDKTKILSNQSNMNSNTKKRHIKVGKKWDLGFIQIRRRFSATRAPSTRTQKNILKLMT